VVPFWAAWPFETLIVPRRPVGRLPELDDRARDSLADNLRRLLRGYDRLFGLLSRTRWAGTRRHSTASTDRLAAPRPFLPAPAAGHGPKSWSATSCSPSLSAMSLPRPRRRFCDRPSMQPLRGGRAP